MFPVPGLSSAILCEQRCIGLVQDANELLSNIVSMFRAEWNMFWDSSLSQSDMQAQLDYLASIAATDPVDTTVSNVLQAYFTKAKRLIAYITVENPAAFASSRMDISGQYREFLTPGWTYTVDPQTGRFVVGGPCQWRDNTA